MSESVCAADAAGIAGKQGVRGEVALGGRDVWRRHKSEPRHHPRQRRSNRSSSVTLPQAATKSRTNFSAASSLA